MIKPMRKDLIAIAILVVLCALFFWRFLTTDQVDQAMFPKGDFAYQFYAWRAMVFRELRAGRFPLWTPSIYSGYPLQADPQSALFYPPALLINLGALLAGLRTFPFRLLELEVIAHVLLTSLLTYAFLRTQVKGWLNALLGSIAFAYGGYMTGYPLLQMAIIESATWLPLALLGLWGYYQANKQRWLWLTAFAFGMSILGGHPQTSMMVVYTSLAFQVYQLYRARKPWYVGLRDVAFVLIMAGGLSAIQSIPSLQYTRLSTRANLPVAQAGSGFPLADLVQLVLTGLVSQWQPLYVGIWPLLLAGIALLLKPRRDVWFWLGLTIAALLLSFGGQLFGFDIVYLLLPSYRLFRSQERLALLVSFGLSTLAAFGSEALWHAMARISRAQLGRVLRFLAYCLPACFLALLATIWFHRQGLDPSDSGDLPTHLSALFLALAGAAGLLQARLRAGRRRSLWQALALALVVLNLFSLNRAANQVPVDMAYPVTEPIRILSKDKELFRFQNDHRLPPQSASVHGLQEIGGIAPIRLAAYEEFLERAPEALRWQLLNVRYVVTWRGSLVSREGNLIPADMIHREGEGEAITYVHRLREPGPRAWVVRGTYFARNTDEMYEFMSSPYFDPRQAAVLETPLILPPASAAAEDIVEITQHEPMNLQITADLAGQGLLVLSEIAYPGWQAYLDGRKVPILRAYGILRSVVLPGGVSHIEFRYRPLVLYVGGAISACAWLLFLIPFISSLLKARSRDSVQGEQT